METTGEGPCLVLLADFFIRVSLLPNRINGPSPSVPARMRISP
jgi:hypothetical protein